MQATNGMRLRCGLLKATGALGCDYGGAGELPVLGTRTSSGPLSAYSSHIHRKTPYNIEKYSAIITVNVFYYY